MMSLRLSVAFQASTSDISSTVPSITECEPLRSRYSQTQTCGPDMRASLTRFLAHIPELVPLALKHWHSPLCLSLKGGVPSVIPFASNSPVHSRKNTNVQNGNAPASCPHAPCA